MKSRLICAAAIAMSVASCGSSPAPTASAGAAPTVAVAPTSGMMALLNAERAAAGRGPVTEDTRLSQSAAAHAADMVRQGYFSHTGADGSRFTERAAARGYGCAIAENIAWGQRSEAEVMTAWMNSSGHRRNILLPNATEFGIGRFEDHWVLMMGSGC